MVQTDTKVPCYTIGVQYVLARAKHPQTSLKTNSVPSSMGRLHKLKTTQPPVTQADIYTQIPALHNPLLKTPAANRRYTVVLSICP